jgi:hypothetical protein
MSGEVCSDERVMALNHLRRLYADRMPMGHMTADDIAIMLAEAYQALDHPPEQANGACKVVRRADLGLPGA